MSEAYFNLKKRLEQLGYNNHLPVDAVPLVECLTADLLQTTRSLQHYMEISRDAINQRDSLALEAEPYKCDNAKLVKENNHLNQQLMQIKEEHQKILRETKRKIQYLSEEIQSKEAIINKLKYQCRDLGLRSLCAGTLSSRNKMRNCDLKESEKKENSCNSNCTALENNITELKAELQNMRERNGSYCDEIALLRSKIENREDEITRLNMLLEGGRPHSAVIKDCCDNDVGGKISNMLREFHAIEAANINLKKQLQESIEKQHEAMLRALNLADKNKLLEQELTKLDKLALKVEEECNKQISTTHSENIYLREQLNNLTSRNTSLEKDLAEKQKYSIEKLENTVSEIQSALNGALKEKDAFYNEMKVLQTLNKSLEEKLSSALSQVCKLRSENKQDMASQYATKDDLKYILERERRDKEGEVLNIQREMVDALDYFNKNISRIKDCNKSSPENKFVYELHSKICECEHKLLELKNENEHLKTKLGERGSGRNYGLEEKIAELNSENAELAKENIMLSSSLSNRKQLRSPSHEIEVEKMKITIEKFNNEIERLISKNKLLHKDKDEYISRYKEAIEQIDSLKRDLIIKHSQFEQLQEENNSYRINSRSGRASVDHLRDECNFLREQILKMQTDVIKEKTLSSQIKNLQIESERSTNEMQNELLNVQKQLNISKDKNSSLENKCKELNTEISSLRIEKSKLLENIHKIDQERDKLVIEFDQKTETVCLFEKKLSSKSHEIERLESEILELKRKISLNNISEHKLMDYQTKVQFLNGEVQRLTLQNDNAVMENKRLQNDLANTNSSLKVTKIEYQKTQKEVESLRLQLQHYVAEVKRIEDLLSHKEAERSDMLEHFASLSVEANILENNNHSLENESASKSLQLQTYMSRVEELEAKLSDKENTIDSQSARIAAMSCKTSAMENEIKLLTEERAILEKNITYLKELCHSLESEKKVMGQGIENTDSELQLYENKIKKLSDAKAKLELENGQIKVNVQSVENLLSTARREVIELKLALQDATSETMILKQQVNKLNSELIRNREVPAEDTDQISRTIALEETLHSIRQDELDEEIRESREVRRSSRYLHGSTI